MITQGIFVCYIMDLDKGLTENDRKKLYDIFIKTYMRSRQLNNLEISVMYDIYNIVFPFLWTRIDIFESYLKSKKIDEANEFLDETRELS